MQSTPSPPRLAFLFLALALSGCGLSEEQEQERDLYRQHGLVYYQNAQYDRALDQLQRALALDPDDYETLLMAGYALLLQPDGAVLDEAGNVFTDCVDRNPDDFRAHLGLGVTHFLLGVWHEMNRDEKLAKAVEHEEAAAKEDLRADQRGTHEREAERFRKEAAEHEKNQAFWYETAHEPLTAAQELEPKNPFLLQMLAFGQIKLGPDRFERAIEYLAKAIELEDQDLGVHRTNLRLLLHESVYSPADEAKLQRQIEREEGDLRRNHSLTAYLCNVLADQRPEMREALLTQTAEHIEAAMIIDPDYPTPHLNAAKLYHKQAKLAAEAGDRDLQVRFLNRARNELFQFTDKNQMSWADYNVMAREMILYLDEKVAQIEKQPR